MMDAGTDDASSGPDTSIAMDAEFLTDAAQGDDSGIGLDAEFGPDAEWVRDGGPSLADASLVADAGLGDDAGLSHDAALSDDGGPFADAESTADSGTMFDAASALDAELETDLGFAPDAAPNPDAEPAADALPVDLGTPGTGDVWIELDYTNAYTPRSPTWRFSNTPGWGAAQWAMEGDTWPEAWDRFNNMTVGSDPIGTSLLIGSSSQLQLMIGLEEMQSYQSVTVRLEGRSRSTCCSLTFYVTNPLNNCGSSGQMSNDWNPDIIDVDLGTCLLTGPSGRIEAVRIDPQSGTMALRKMRVTLHGASW